MAGTAPAIAAARDARPTVAPRIGLFGGSFDPVHRAHVQLARQARDTLGLDELRWLPAGRPWQKARTLTAAAHRLAMIEQAIAGEPKFVVDPREIGRDGPTYTVDTVRECRAERPGVEWVLVIGQDQYAGLHSWQGWRELLGLVTLAVANRPGVAPAVDPEVQALPHRLVPLPMMEVSSSEVRERLARGQPVDHLVPAAVAGYIARQGLYRPNPTGS
jgi:nicotinate-nucleotide adenylyltransferase